MEAGSGVITVVPWTRERPMLVLEGCAAGVRELPRVGKEK